MKILVFPKDQNPYQSLLYKSMPSSAEVVYLHAKQTTALGSFLYTPKITLELLINRIQGFKILHIHWLYSFGLPARIPFSKKFALINTLVFLYYVKFLGYKIVWTVHNVLPHEPITSNDLYIRKKLGTIASAIIVHSSSTIPELKKLGIKLNNVHIVPHGTYQGAYPDNLSRNKTRSILGIGSKEFVFVFFGRIATYKNVPELIETFIKLTKTHKHTTLIIAGNSSGALKVAIERKKIEIGKKLITQLSYIPDNEVQIYFKSADVSVYPFQEITTSGSVIAALSFGVPVIAPRLGALKELPNNIGYFYDTNDKNGLRKAMDRAIEGISLHPQLSKNAKRYSESLSWDKISDKTYNLYQKV